MSAAKKKKSGKKNKSNKQINTKNNVQNEVKKDNLPEEKNEKNVSENVKEDIEKVKIEKVNTEIEIKENDKLEIKENTDEELNSKAEADEIEKTKANKKGKKANKKNSNKEKSVENKKVTDKEIEKSESADKNKATDKNQANSKTENNEKKDLVKVPPKDVAKTEEKPEYVQEMIKNSKKRKRILACTIILIILLILVSTLVAILNLKNTNMMDGIKIKNIEVSNISQDEAKQLVETAMNKELLAEIDLNYGEDYKVTLKPEQIEFNYDIESAIEEAYLIGREGNIVENNYTIIFTSILGKDIDISYSYNGDLLNQFVEDINSKLPGVVVEPNYYIEDNKLIVNKGTDGLQVKKEDLKNQIIQAIVSRNALEMQEGYEQVIEIPVENIKASPIDMKKIHAEVYSEPQDAYYELDPYKIYADVDGIDLAISPEEAQNMVLAEDKTEYTFDLKITEAEKTIDELGTEAFPYLISSFSTKYDASNKNRSTNLKIAAEKINGKVLMPGEEFSFNKVVGKRTVEEGYKDAKIYADGGVVDGLAGGICQISSTLYNSVLLANLQITERRNHSFTTSYVAAGKDATVVWGTTDFRFINSRSYPIKIEASVNNGIADFKIHGMQEEVEYEVKIIPVKTKSIPYTTTYEEDASIIPGQQIVKQSGHAGYKVTTYKELRQNGVVVSKEVISNDTYNPMRTIIRVAPGHVPVQ